MARTKSYPGHITKRGEAYRVELRVGAERFRYTLPGVTLSEAREFARDEHRRLVRLVERGLPVRMRMSQLINEYEAEHLPTLRASSRRGYEMSLDSFREFFVKQKRDPLVYRMQPRLVRQYLVWRRNHTRVNEKWRRTPKQLSPRTVQKERSVLFSLFERAVADEIVDANPVRRAPTPTVKRRPPVILDEKQAAKLLDECRDRPRSPMLFAYAVTLFETGARSKSEALWLRWSDVDLETGWVTLRSSYRRQNKDEETRHVPMTPLLQRTLQEHAKRYRECRYNGNRSPWVFHHTRNRPGAKPGDRLKSIPALAKAAERAGVPEDWVPHDLRHRRATSWIEAGQDVSLVKDAMGHADIQMTNWYTHIRREHLKPLADHGLDYQDDAAELGTRTGT